MFESPFESGPLPPASTTRGRNTSEGVIKDLECEVERLRIVCEALWRIMRDKQGVDEQELIRQMTIIDMEDGRLDGRVNPKPPPPCPKCNRVLAKTRPRCLFCGEPVALDPFMR